jgi:hypothetical protein
VNTVIWHQAALPVIERGLAAASTLIALTAGP